MYEKKKKKKKQEDKKKNWQNPNENELQVETTKSWQQGVARGETERKKIAVQAASHDKARLGQGAGNRVQGAGCREHGCRRVKWRQGGQRKRRKVCNVLQSKVSTDKTLFITRNGKGKGNCNFDSLSLSFTLYPPLSHSLFFGLALPLKVFEPILVSEIACECRPIGFG